MRALLDASSVMPKIRRYATRRGITVQQALLDREMAALSLLAEACEHVASNEEHLDAYRSATEAGLLPAMTRDGAR